MPDVVVVGHEWPTYVLTTIAAVGQDPPQPAPPVSCSHTILFGVEPASGGYAVRLYDNHPAPVAHVYFHCPGWLLKCCAASTFARATPRLNSAMRSG